MEVAGSHGHEGTGMLAGHHIGDERWIDRFLAPDQNAGTFPDCWVEVTRLGKQQLALGLEPGERWLARIHSHPGAAFHSRTDDANPGLTADRALSIVVPYFGLGLRRGLESCSVYERRGGRWLLRSPEELGLVLA